MMEATQNCAMVRCLLPHSLLRMASARCKPLKPPLQSFNSLSAAKISSAARGGLQRLAAHDILHGGRRAEKGCRKERQVQIHAARRGGSGTGGAVAQFSTGRRYDYWQCTGRLWSSGFAAAPHSKPAGVALATPLVGDRVRLAPRPHRSSPPSSPPPLRLRTRRPCTRGRPTLPLVVHPAASPSTLDPTRRHPHRRRRSHPLPPRRGPWPTMELGQLTVRVS